MDHRFTKWKGAGGKVNYEQVTMPEILKKTARQHPDQVALLFYGSRITYRQFDAMVNRIANALVGIGLNPGDRVALLLPNIPQIAIAVNAIWRAGAVVVMNNPLYTDTELERQLNDSGAKVLVCLDLLAPRVLDLMPNTGIRRIIVAHIRDHLDFPKKQFFPFLSRGKHRRIRPVADLVEWTDLLKSTTDSPPDIPLSLEDTAALQYTGGTTGVSKGVMLSHANLSCNAQQGRAVMPNVEVGEIVLGSLPIFHAFGAFTLNLCVLCGFNMILIPRPTSDELLKAASKNRVTIFPAVPTMLIGLLNHSDLKEYDLSSLKICISGAAPCPVDVIQGFEKLTGCQVVEGFGITEASPITHINPIGGINKPGSIGLPVPDTQVKIVSLDNGKSEMPVSEPGELCIKGPQVSEHGYYNMPQETALTFREGWLYTGDIAYRDSDGYTFIVDRKKDMILAGGYNIYPREIDEVLFDHPGILEACAKGVPDDYRGESVKAFVVPQPGVALTEEAVIEWCRQKLAAYKVPKYVEFIDELPKSTVGKILRKVL